MKPIQKIHTTKLKHYCSLLILSILALTSNAQKLEWEEIALIDTLHYSSFSTNHIPDARYPITNLFDMNLGTCWVSKLSGNNGEPVAYMTIPNNIPSDIVLSIFSGFGKSKNLHAKNARPSKIRISIYYGIVGDGFFSENGFMALACKIGDAQEINLEDTFAIQEFKLIYDYKAAGEKIEIMKRQFSEELGMSIYEGHRIIRLEVIDSYPGTRYDDVCISSIYFNDCFIVESLDKDLKIKSVYVNEDEDALLYDSDKNKGVIAYQDSTSVIQLIETSSNNRWAIALVMSKEIEGRVETYYELIDLANGKSVTTEIFGANDDFISANELRFKEEGEDLYIIQSSLDAEYKIRLCELQE